MPEITYKVMACEKLRRNQKRARFDDVLESIGAQIDDLGGDLENALIIAPKNATHRQVQMAIARLTDV